MAKLPKDKQEALKFIEQYNNAIKTCLEQDNIAALKETMGIRDQIIQDFFENFKNELTEKDIQFYIELKSLDEEVVENLEVVKSKILIESSEKKKSRDGIRSYNRVANKKWSI
ncbi:MAG: hypothetical protein RPT25_11455 [Cycloclasticus sp.]|jgi:hypothetical protein